MRKLVPVVVILTFCAPGARADDAPAQQRACAIANLERDEARSLIGALNERIVQMQADLSAAEKKIMEIQKNAGPLPKKDP